MIDYLVNLCVLNDLEVIVAGYITPKVLKLILLLDSIATVKAVSYTHLRAHETPEHLVCRLLLEKKKNTTIHNVLTILTNITIRTHHENTKLQTM